MNVAQLLAGIEYLGLKGDDEIVIRSIDGEIIDASPEIKDGGMVIRAEIIAQIEDDRDCFCGEHDCHYCGR